MKLKAGLLGIGLLLGASALAQTAEPFADLNVGMKPQRPATPSETGPAYDPRTTALLINLCRESLCRIVSNSDRVSLDEEYSRLANNIDVTLIRDDEIAELIKRLLIELNALKLDEASKARVVGQYDRQLNASVLQAVRCVNPLLGPASGPVQLACQAILLTAWGTTNRAKALRQYNQDLEEKVFTLQAEELKRLTQLRTDFFGTEYVLYRRYRLPDRLNLKEVQLEQYIRVCQDEDPARRLQRLERLKGDFDAYPPFWYQIGLAAQESSNAPLALRYYRRFDDIAVPVLREDPDRVALCMHRIMLLDQARDRDAIVRDLETIERNTKYYYRWENLLFAALTYYGLGDAENARRLIQVSIDEGYQVPLHEQVRVSMESAVAQADLEGTRRDMLKAAEGKRLAELMTLGRLNGLEAVRAMGNRITDIRLAVEPRSRGKQNAAFVMPVYNVYLLGRSAFRGDVYFDNVIARLPAAWLEDKSLKPALVFNATTIKPAEKKRDRRTGDLVIRFPRVFNQDDIVQEGRAYPCTLRLESKQGTIEIGYQAERVGDDLLRVRPDLSKKEPYFEMRSISYAGKHFRLDHGLFVPE